MHGCQLCAEIEQAYRNLPVQAALWARLVRLPFSMHVHTNMHTLCTFTKNAIFPHFHEHTYLPHTFHICANLGIHARTCAGCALHPHPHTCPPATHSQTCTNSASMHAHEQAVLSNPIHTPAHEDSLAVVALHCGAHDTPRAESLGLLFHLLTVMPAFR